MKLIQQKKSDAFQNEAWGNGKMVKQDRELVTIPEDLDLVTRTM